MNSQGSEPPIVSTIFSAHHDYYLNLGIETIKQQAGQVEQVSSDYQGRVIYELLQNAFDKADKHILVKVHQSSLYIANDGSRFSYANGYNYTIDNYVARGDFQSLCSISTSTKSAETSIGNKGVGFKSSFSIAKDGYVNIYSKGDILLEEGASVSADINFRIYESFKDAENLPAEFSEATRIIVKKQIEAVQKERKERGVPGYYFPILLKSENFVISELMEQGFVTVIEIPFAEEQLEAVQELVAEIKAIHFQFIQLKQQRNFYVQFESDCIEEENPLSFTKKVKINSQGEQFVSISLGSKLEALAKKAGIAIENPQIAFYIHDVNEPENKVQSGLLYNYLPTKVGSPFKNVDFHADFHTTVDRKSINFDGKIGDYNEALLEACLELYFTYLNSYLNEDDRVVLHLEYISPKNLPIKPLKNFSWFFFKFNKSFFESSFAIKRILGISRGSYDLPSEFMAALAKKYFSTPRPLVEHKMFFKTSLWFIGEFARSSGQRHKLTEQFIKNFAQRLKIKYAQIIPSGKNESFGTVTLNRELFFRSSKNEYSSKRLSIPSFVGISVTDFEIENRDFKSTLGIVDLTDTNAVLKYYKQTSYSGEFSKTEFLTEEQQKELIRSVAEIFENRTISNLNSTHRYTNTFTNWDRNSNSTANQAYFIISTIFLKTNDGKYKPAQLCRKRDLDIDFVASCLENKNLDSFLKFLGVSLSSKYIFADKNIYDRLKDGLDFIPSLQDRTKGSEKLSGEKLLSDIRIIHVSGGTEVHPALVNENNYSFLINIDATSIKSELETLRVKQYAKFPDEYLTILIDCCKKNLSRKSDMVRLYQQLFSPYHFVAKQYLVSHRGQLKLTDKQDFYIANSVADYQLLKDQDIKLLCFYTGSEIPENLRHLKITLKEGAIKSVSEEDITALMKNIIEEKIAYLLTEVSNSPLSTTNYYDDPLAINQVIERLDKLTVYQTSDLSREVFTDKGSLSTTIKKVYDIDYNINRIYLHTSSTTKNRAEALSKYLFNNNVSIAPAVELVLYYKSIEQLDIEYDNDKIIFFKSRWVADYDDKFSSFQSEVLEPFIDEGEIVEQGWHIYNSNHKSSLLHRLDQGQLLPSLRERIEFVKTKYDGLFDHFSLEIDYSLNDDTIARLISHLSRYNDSEGEKQKVISRLQHLATKLGSEKAIEEVEQIIYK